MQFPEQPVFPLGEEKDYTIWLAHSTDPGDYGDGCILGYKEQFLRLRKSSVCQNGRDYVVTKQPSVCPCSLEDFLWYQHPSVPCQPLSHARGHGTQLSYRTEQYFNPFSFLLPQEWRTAASHSGNWGTEKETKVVNYWTDNITLDSNYWAELAATTKNPDLATVGRREVNKEEENYKIERGGDRIKTPRKVAQEVRGYWTGANSWWPELAGRAPGLGHTQDWRQRECDSCLKQEMTAIYLWSLCPMKVLKPSGWTPRV